MHSHAGKVQYNTIQYNTVQYTVLQYTVLQYTTLTFTDLFSHGPWTLQILDRSCFIFMFYSINLVPNLQCTLVVRFYSCVNVLKYSPPLSPLSQLFSSFPPFIPLSIPLLHCHSRFPIWTIHEYKTFDVLVTVLSAFGLPMVLYFVIGSLMDRQKRRTQYLRIIYASTALVLAIWVLALAHNPAKYFCKDNAIAYNSIYDGKHQH